jgi:hypothetical protein
MLQSALCLCPLLAQQIPQASSQTAAIKPAQFASEAGARPSLPEFIAVRKGTKIEVMALDTISSETAAAGALVRFAVAKDVVVDGATVIHAGSPVMGVVTRVKRGVPYRQWPELTIRVKEVEVANGTKLRLTDSDPRSRKWPLHSSKDYAECAILLPLCIASLFGVVDDGPEKPNAQSGQQVVLSPCTVWKRWTATAKNVQTAALANDETTASRLSFNACSGTVENRGVYFPEIR